ncbi:MAG TPA: hypothetical protein VM600_08850, partial [Actinomycetota bacterium]|nr:hypothetical protein [Actinomycetota bacterium]
MTSTDTSLQEIVFSLRDRRADLRAAHEAGLGGLELVRALSAAMDDALRAIWREVAPASEGASV